MKKDQLLFYFKTYKIKLVTSIKTIPPAPQLYTTGTFQNMNFEGSHIHQTLSTHRTLQK